MKLKPLPTKKTSIATAVTMLLILSGQVSADAIISDSSTTVNLDSLSDGPVGMVDQNVTVDVTSGEALRATNQQWQINNAGTLKSSDANAFAVQLTNGNYIANAPTGNISGVYGGINSVNSATAIYNFGVIEATGGTAIRLSAGGGLENKTSGIIKGADYGLHLQNSSDQVINDGQIIATNTSGTSTAVYLNGGTVRLRNTGTISGGLYGIQLVNGTQTVINVGTIEAVTGGTGVGTGVEFSSGGTLTNAIGAEINGGQYGVWTQNGASQVTTAGLITGGTNSVVFSTGNGTLTMQTGAKLVGSALGGGSSHIILEGNGLAENDFLNFGSLDMTGTEWTLVGRTEAQAATVSSGRLIIGAPGYTGAILDSNTVDINSGTEMVGYNSQINGTLTNNGKLYVGSGYTFSGSPAPSTLTVTGSMNNNGQIILSSGAPYGNTLYLNGHYTGGGSLTLGASLNDSDLGALANQKADRLLIHGNATGSTQINVLATSSALASKLESNLAITSNAGVSLVQVSGSAKEDTFTMKGYVSGGTPYQFKLFAFGPESSRGPAAVDQNIVGNPYEYWDYRLEREYVTAIPLPPGEIIDFPLPGEEENGGGDGKDSGRWKVVPQLPGYVSLANALFNTGLQDLDSLHRRLGEIRDSQATKDHSTEAETFVRVYGGPSTYHTDVSFQNYGYDADVDYTATQLGGSAVIYNDDNATIRLGGALTIGYSELKPKAVDGYSKTTTNTQNAAAIATYQHKDGWYADAILSVGNIDAKTNTEYYSSSVASIDGTSYAASLEVGYPFALGSSGLSLEPQLQYVWQNLRFKDFTDIDGIKTSLGNPTEDIIRAGFRMTYPLQTKIENQLTPYVKVNYLQSLNGNGSVNIGSYDFAMGEYGKAIQVGAGISGMVNKNLSLFAEFAWQDNISSSGWDGWQLTGGIRYMFGAK